MNPPEAELQSRVVEPDEMLVRPGTYFNPQTEVIVVVVDDVAIDQEIFDMEDYEGSEWVHISDDVPADSAGLDAAMQSFQTTFHPVASRATEAAADEELDANEGLGEEEELEPDPDPDEAPPAEEES